MSAERESLLSAERSGLPRPPAVLIGLVVWALCMTLAVVCLSVVALWGAA